VPINLAKGILGTIANILIIAQVRWPNSANIGEVLPSPTSMQSVIKNKSDFQAIIDKCEAIRQILERATKDATEETTCEDTWGMHYPSLTSEPSRFYHRRNLLTLCRSVNRISSDVASKKEQGFFRRLFAVTIDRDKIAAWEKDLDRVLGLFNVCLSNFISTL
jgi:hypothetical protein